MDNEENLVGGTVAEPLPTASVKVLSFVNLALMQNGLPVMQDLRIANRSDSSLKDVVCAFSSEDGLIVPGQLALGEIGPGETAGRHPPHRRPFRHRPRPQARPWPPLPVGEA